MAIRLKHLPSKVQARLLKQAKPSKYRNIRVVIDGRSFLSRLEGAVYLLLKGDLRREAISKIEFQPTVRLSKANIVYRPDFRVWYPDGRSELVEAKGKETAEWRIKRKLFLYYGSERLRIFKGCHKNPTEVEVIVPVALR